MAPMAVGPGGLPWENIPTQEQFEREVLANEIQYSHAQQRFITEPDVEAPYSSIEDAVDRLLPYFMFCDEECDAVHLRHSLGLELNSEPGPMLCNSRQLVNVLLQEKAKEILVKAVPLGTRLEAILQRTDELRQLGTLPEDGLKMEREQMEGARALWHLENHRWTSAISTYNAEQDQRRQAMLAAQQQRDQQAAQQRAAAAAAAAVPANSSDQAIATGQQYQRSGANPAAGGLNHAGAQRAQAPSGGVSGQYGQMVAVMVQGPSGPQLVMVPAQVAQQLQQQQQQQL